MKKVIEYASSSYLLHELGTVLSQLIKDGQGGILTRSALRFGCNRERINYGLRMLLSDV
jgi:hypothetical protein